MDIIIKASQLLMSLSILVVLHELGHFIPAKLFKTKVEKFYLFFDPWFSVLKKKIGDTEYGVGWLPLGGYVKIAGMIDESMDKDQMKKAPEKWEFRAKPAWQRLIIMVGGVAVNLLLGVFIYSLTLFVYGDKYLPNDSLNDGVWCTEEMAENLGFKTGDKIVSADGKKIERFTDVLEKIIVSDVITVERSGERVDLYMPENVVDQFLNATNKLILMPRIPTVISGFSENSNAKKAGLLKNDIIVGMNGVRYKYFDQFKLALEDCRGKNVDLIVERSNEEIILSCLVSSEGKLGFVPGLFSFSQLEEFNTYTFASQNFSLLQSFPAGYKKAKKKLLSYIDQFKLILNPNTGAYKGMGGFGAIGSLFPATWNWEAFWNLTAFLSLMLAFMNLLPIPALDGGHVMFLLYEIIVGKPAPEKFMEYAQAVGMFLLLALVVYANANDIFRLL